VTTTARIRTSLAAPFLVVALVLSGLTASAPSGEPSRVLLAAEGAVDAAVAAVVEAGGTIVDRFDGLGVVVADVPDADVLRADPRVAAVEADRAIAPQSREDSAAPGADLPPVSWTAPQSIGADEAWAAGTTGEGVGIAIVDTGVDLTPVTRDSLAVSIDTTPEQRLRDGFGHGTFMAALAAGSTDVQTGFSGVAPDAHVVSIKVADREGGATTASVLSGLAAADAAREWFGVRVVLLAAGGPDEPGEDVLELVLRQLWARGLVVVVPSGNASDDGVASPGVDPYLLTVGAVDDRGTADVEDDVVPDWSAFGDGKPDVTAPGVSVVSARAPGSLVDREHPGSRISGDLFRGSGTSMAAAVTAGAAALLLDAEPDLTPDEVKGRLVASAGETGIVDVAEAISTTAPAANAHLPAIELWESDPEAEIPEWLGNSWVGNSWVGNSWVGNSWVGNSWVGNSWVGNSWVGNSWSSSAWTGHSWAGMPYREPHRAPEGNSWV
jgi:serine protease AprX